MLYHCQIARGMDSASWTRCFMVVVAAMEVGIIQGLYIWRIIAECYWLLSYVLRDQRVSWWEYPKHAVVSNHDSGTNCIWSLSGPRGFFASANTICVLFILWKFIPISVPKMRSKLEDEERVLQEKWESMYLLGVVQKRERDLCASFVTRECQCEKSTVCIIIMKHCIKRDCVILKVN